jgi:hypothetical protein
MRRRYNRHGSLSRLVAALAGVLITFGLAGVASAGASRAATALAPATLVILNSTYAETQSPLYFQVVGEGFRPGEPVTLQATLEPAGGDSDQPPALAPVHVLANAYGQVAATIDGGGYVGTGDGFIIRAIGDQHAASIIDLALAGASWTAPAGS